MGWLKGEDINSVAGRLILEHPRELVTTDLGFVDEQEFPRQSRGGNRTCKGMAGRSMPLGEHGS